MMAQQRFSHQTLLLASHVIGVEGAESLQELVAMLESGEYDEIVEFEGDDEEWAQLNNACHADHHHHKPHTSDS